jgi:SAM-dependent methyltransferase
MVERVKSKLVRTIQYLSSNPGYCPICERQVRFITRDKWLRDNYICSGCHSIPRYRALIDTIKRFYPEFESLIVHESSPNRGGSSYFLKTRCKNYTSSQYFPDVPRGEYKDGYRSEDLSALTFPDQSIDLLVTQDVFEHVMEPEKAFKEIARVLKPGGAHIFSMPWYPKLQNTIQRARMEKNEIVYLEEPVYHGNPVDRKKGALVTYDWGQDFIDIIYRSGGMYTTVYLQKDRGKGLDGDFLEIFVSRKNHSKS